MQSESKKAKATRCLESKDGKLSWNKELMKCRTCADLEPLSNNDSFTIKCGFSSDRAFSLKQCSFSCKNGEKIEPLSQVFNILWFYILSFIFQWGIYSLSGNIVELKI